MRFTTDDINDREFLDFLFDDILGRGDYYKDLVSFMTFDRMYGRNRILKLRTGEMILQVLLPIRIHYSERVSFGSLDGARKEEVVQVWLDVPEVSE